MHKVAILMPVLDHIKAHTEDSLYKLRTFSKDVIAIEDKLIGSRNIQLARNLLVARVLKDNNISHVCMIDADMTFPPQTLKYLLAADKDVIGVLYTTRAKPIYFCAFKQTGQNHFEPIYQFKHAVEEVDAVGSGFMLIKREVLKGMETPFAISGNYTEDVEFCLRARKRGFKIYVDTRIRCGHIGDYEFTVDDVPEGVFSYEA